MYGVKVFIRQYRTPKGRYAVAAWFTADEASKWVIKVFGAVSLSDIRIFKIPETNQEKGA